MSGLAALLAGRKDARHLHDGTARFDVADVRHTVEHAGWTLRLRRRTGTRRPPEFLAGSPRRWSSRGFREELRRVGRRPAGRRHDGAGTVLLWDGYSPFCRHDDQAFSVALSVLGGRVNAERGGPFAVLLRGEGPRRAGRRQRLD